MWQPIHFTGELQNVTICGTFFLGQAVSLRTILQHPTVGCRMGLSPAAIVLGTNRQWMCGGSSFRLDCQLLLPPSFQCSVSPLLFTACALSSGTRLSVPLLGEKLPCPPSSYLAYLTPEPHQFLHWEAVALLLDFSSSSS